MDNSIEKNVENLLAQIPPKNPYGERVTLVAAVKFQPSENINRAIAAGITDIGDNHPQEFRDKYADITGDVRRHFFGHLQSNKIKYLLGRCCLYQSIDRLSIARELSEISAKSGVISDILLEINIGGESSKGGFAPEELQKAYSEIKTYDNLKVRGLMAMMPLGAEEREIADLAARMRGYYDNLRAHDANIDTLSMGMSGDWRICVEAGSNMIRLGTAIFGARGYAK